MLEKITEITFKQKDVIDIGAIPVVYCIETPYTLFHQYSDKHILLVTTCDEYGKIIGDMILKWDNIECVREVTPKEKHNK